MDTKGYTYFRINSDLNGFNQKCFEEYLSLKPTEFQEMHEKNGKIPVTNIWSFGKEEESNPFFYEQAEEIIKKLMKHREELKSLKKKESHVSFTLQFVLYLGEESPGLSLEPESIAFLGEIGASIDVDMYNNK